MFSSVSCQIDNCQQLIVFSISQVRSRKTTRYKQPRNKSENIDQQKWRYLSSKIGVFLGAVRIWWSIALCVCVCVFHSSQQILYLASLPWNWYQHFSNLREQKKQCPLVRLYRVIRCGIFFTTIQFVSHKSNRKITIRKLVESHLSWLRRSISDYKIISIMLTA